MRWDLARSSEISLDLDEISLDQLDKSPKYENLLLESENLKSEAGNLGPESGKSRRNLEIFAGFWKFLLEILSTLVGSRFYGFWRGKSRPTRRSQFLEQMTHCRPMTWSGRPVFWSDPVGTFGWIRSSDWMDSPNIYNIHDLLASKRWKAKVWSTLTKKADDDVWISSVERAQLPPIPSLEGTTSSSMVTDVVPATTPPTLKLGIKECNVLKQNNVNDSFSLNIPLFFVVFFCLPPNDCAGQVLYVVLGASRCDWPLLL